MGGTPSAPWHVAPHQYLQLLTQIDLIHPRRTPHLLLLLPCSHECPSHCRQTTTSSSRSRRLSNRINLSQSHLCIDSTTLTFRRVDFVVPAGDRQSFRSFPVLFKLAAASIPCTVHIAAHGAPPSALACVPVSLSTNTLRLPLSGIDLR